MRWLEILAHRFALLALAVTTVVALVRLPALLAADGVSAPVWAAPVVAVWVHSPVLLAVGVVVLLAAGWTAALMGGWRMRRRT